MRVLILLITSLLIFNQGAKAGESYSPLYKSVNELSADMQAGVVSAHEITRFYLARIEKLNPTYRAVISINTKAEEIAAQLDKERSEGKSRGPLHGIPVLLKDNINSRDPMPTTAGSLALKENYATEDAPLVKSLRAAGVIILGKANLSEWANMRSTKSISGWSAMGGFTANAWNPAMNPCGSSAGSAVAAALNLAPLTVGSETDGSIICPASRNGVVGFKPGVGMVSQAGIIPISHSQDTAGPITRSVADAVFLLQGMLTSNAGVSAADLQHAIDNAGFSDIKIGVVRAYTGHEKTIDKAFNDAVQILQKAGAELVDVSDAVSIDGLGQLEITRLLADMKADMSEYLKSAPDTVKVRNMGDIIAFNKANKETEMEYFKQEFLLLAERSPALASVEYQKINSEIKKLLSEKGIEAILEKNKLDILVAPSFGVAGLLMQERKSATPKQPGSSQLSAMAGLPAITVPMAIIEGLPIGISFMAGKNSEPLLIRTAAGFEQARGDFDPPTITD